MKPLPGKVVGEEHPLFEEWMRTGYVNGAGDSSLYEKRLWFDDPNSSEIIEATRPSSFLKTYRLSIEELQQVSSRWDLNIERLATMRAVPFYCKEVTAASNLIAGWWFLTRNLT
jgi:hypothetical protein